MPRTRKKDSPGQKLWLGLYCAESYDQEAKKTVVPPGSPGPNPEAATKRWLEGMSRHLKESFPTGLRQRREGLGLTQQRLADIAGLTVTAVAMIERGERAPNLDTAARLCWALDLESPMESDGEPGCRRFSSRGDTERQTEEACMCNSWLKMIGTADHPWPDSQPYNRKDVGFRSRRPTGIQPGDQMILYAVGTGRIFALTTATTSCQDSQEPGWPYRVEIDKCEPNLAPRDGVDIDELSTAGRDLRHSIRQRSHIRLRPQEYARAVTRLQEVATSGGIPEPAAAPDGVGV